VRAHPAQDRDELWQLCIVPPVFSGEAATKLTGSFSDFENAEFRARQARQAAMLYQTPAAAGHNTMHLRVLGQAARERQSAPALEREAARIREETAVERATAAAAAAAAATARSMPEAVH
jgi:hypothetical protein